MKYGKFRGWSRKAGAVLVSAGLLAVGLSTSADAAQVGTIVNEYPGDTEAQARMLYDLGLFKGTDEGFQLDKPMTRAQAAVMLVRLLGVEQAALANQYTHPFTDVPEWASPYIGWLYQSGVTKGTSVTTYGSRSRVTCRQYSTFLTRACRDDETYLVIDENDINACDAAGFLRGDAVSLSTRLLGMFYEKNNNSDGTSVAQHLIEQGAFTREQLKDAAWDVLPRECQMENARGSVNSSDGDFVFACVIAGVPVVRNEATTAHPMLFFDDMLMAQTYGYILSDNYDSYTICIMDPKTLEVIQTVDYPVNQDVMALGSINGTDYVARFTGIGVDDPQYSPDGSVLAIRGSEVRELDWVLDEEDRGSFPAYTDKNICVFPLKTDDKAAGRSLAVIDASGEHVLTGIQGKPYTIVNDRLITQDVTPERSTLSCWKTTGELVNSLTVDNLAVVPDGYEGDNDYWMSYSAPSLHWQGEAGTPEEGLLWGLAGVYRVQDGTLTQLTARPTVACKVDPADNSLVIIATEPDKRVSYWGAGVQNMAGDEVVRIQPDGTETMLLSDTPAHGLDLDSITCAENGEVRVVYSYVMGMADWHSYEYAIENGRPRPLVHLAGWGFSGYSEEGCAQEQARLDKLYSEYTPDESDTDAPDKSPSDESNANTPAASDP